MSTKSRITVQNTEEHKVKAKIIPIRASDFPLRRCWTYWGLFSPPTDSSGQVNYQADQCLKSLSPRDRGDAMTIQDFWQEWNTVEKEYPLSMLHQLGYSEQTGGWIQPGQWEGYGYFVHKHRPLIEDFTLPSPGHAASGSSSTSVSTCSSSSSQLHVLSWTLSSSMKPNIIDSTWMNLVLDVVGETIPCTEMVQGIYSVYRMKYFRFELWLSAPSLIKGSTCLSNTVKQLDSWVKQRILPEHAYSVMQLKSFP